MNILDLVLADGIAPEKVSHSEYHSSCPICGGRDRFSIKPDEVNSNGKYMGGRYICRVCGIFGDAISYLQKFKSMTYQGALKYMDIDDSATASIKTQTATIPDTWRPNSVWSKRARQFTDYCHEHLLRNPDVLGWLQRERGLNLDTVKRFRLGLNEHILFDDCQKWGLVPKLNIKTGKPKSVALPDGIVIPFCLDSAVVRIRIRKDKSDKYGRYHVVSESCPYVRTIWNLQDTVCIIENELDSLLIIQECEDICGAIALGTAKKKLDADLDRRLSQAKLILVSHDKDEAGSDAAWRNWKKYHGFYRYVPGYGKDVSEQFKAGVPVRFWIEHGIQTANSARQKEKEPEQTKPDDAAGTQQADCECNPDSSIDRVTPETAKDESFSVLLKTHCPGRALSGECCGRTYFQGRPEILPYKLCDMQNCQYQERRNEVIEHGQMRDSQGNLLPFKEWLMTDGRKYL